MKIKHLEVFLKSLIYCSFVVPLVVMPASFIFPFIVPKILLFRSLTVLMLASYGLLLKLDWQKYRPRLSPLSIAVLLFFLSFAISTFVGVDAYHSFWDNHERMLGLFTIFHFIGFYFVCTAIFKDWKDWRIALMLFLVAGFVVMFIAFLQTQNPSLLLNQGSLRTSSTLGNPIYVGGYSLFLTFVAFLLFIKEKNNWLKSGIAILGFLSFLGMFWSGTRGSMLGFVAGSAVALIGYAIVLKQYPKVRLGILGLMIFGVLAIGLLYYFRTTDFVSNIPAVGRTLNTSLTDVKNSARWIAWTIAVESWKEKPVFGWGPNNYFYAFNAHYNPRSLDFGYGETWFDNAHNIILNTLAVQGIFGLISYLSVFAIAILGLVIARRKEGLNYHLAIIGSAFLVAHLVGNITVFENPTSYLYFMFWLAMVNSFSSYKKLEIIESNKKMEKNWDKKPELTVGNGTVITFGILAFLIIFIFNIQPARANVKTLNAIRDLSQDPRLSMDSMKVALQFSSPHIDDIRSDIARTVGQILGTYYQKIGLEKSNEILDFAYDNLKKNLILHPLDIRNQLSLSQLAQLKALMNQDGRYILESEGLLEDALSKSPKRQQIVYSLTAIKLQMGKFDEAIKMLEETITDNPHVSEGYWRLAYTLKVAGKDQKAKEILDLAKHNNIEFDEQGKSIIAQIMTTTAITSTKSNIKSKK